MAENLFDIRRKKLDALAERSVEPYALKFDDPIPIAEALAAFEENGEGTEARVAGRIMAIRGSGKTAFVDVHDRSGKLQAYFRKDELGQERFGTLKLFDTPL